MRKIEFALAVLLGLSILLRDEVREIAAYLMAISVTILIPFYFLLGFALFNGVRFRDFLKRKSYINIKGSYIGLGILTGLLIVLFLSSIVFRIMHWPYGGIGLKVSTAILFIVLLSAIAIRNKGNNNVFFTEVLPRSSFYGSMGIVMMM